MSDADLAARLAVHEEAFEGLLDLIPQKLLKTDEIKKEYKKKKQTKLEAAKAKRAKLDPDRVTRVKKDGSTQTDSDAAATADQKPKTNGTLRSDKLQKSTERRQKKREEKRAKVAQQAGAMEQHKQAGTMDQDQDQSTETTKQEQKPAATINQDSITTETEVRPTHNPEMNDNPIANGETPKSKSERNISDIQARLAAKIAALQAKRKAPGSGVDGAPKSRDAILELRRKREAARSERKKMEKEARKAAAAAAADQGTIKSEDEEGDEDDDDEEEDKPAVDVKSDDDDGDDQAVTYGKVTFAKGEQLKPDGSGVTNSRKRKQQDAHSALQAALNKKARLAALPEDKQSKIVESDSWHKLLLQADGEKVKDDVSLLKASVKRKEGQKKKSTKEWKERLNSIAKAKALKQKNREKNLIDRKNSKGMKGGHKKGKQIGAWHGKKKKAKEGF